MQTETPRASGQLRKLLLLLIIGGMLGAATLRALQYLAFQIPTPSALIADGAVYEGSLIDGVLNGEGRMRWSNGDRYEGGFKDGLFHGQGYFQGSDGSSYRGDYLAGKATGKGTIVFSDSEQYTGDVLNSRMHGHGLLQADNTTYEGDFVDNHFHGKGTYTDRHGDTYRGDFIDDDFHGEGEYRTTDGRIYSGSFVEGQFTGTGSYRDNKGTHYQGEFLDWYYNGDGELLDEAGDRYSGMFNHGELDGNGSYQGKDGSTYEGEFRYGNFDGKGVFTSAKGNIYEGQFRYGRYHGTGTLTYARPLDNIDKIYGRWRNGTLVEAIRPALLVNPGIINEATLYNQHELLQKSWDQLEPNDPNKVDLYFLGISGDGSQAVFRREVEFVKNYFDEHLHTRNKSIALINARSTVMDIPLATNTSIRRSLAEIAKRMDPQNDILVIYMTSHGSSNFEFSLNQAGMQLPDLPAEKLAAMLDELPLRWKVIVVSACYSGGFIPQLENESTLVITAAAKTKTSFGCSDDTEFTYFGRAYFEEAFVDSHDFVGAFDRAIEIVRQREVSEGFEHSQPQIHKPQAIQDQLARWYRDQASLVQASSAPVD